MDEIPGFWRFHFIYFIFALIFSWAFFPLQVYASFALIGLICLAGLALLLLKQHIGSQIVAFALGLGTPVVFFIQLTLASTAVLFAILIVATFFARDLLFFR